MKTPAIFCCLILVLLAFACNVPDLKKPAFSKLADTIFVRYKEAYQAESIALGWSMTGDSIASLKVTVRNSGRYSFEQTGELQNIATQFSNELIAVLNNADEFSTIEIDCVWQSALITKNFSAAFPVSQSTSASVSTPAAEVGSTTETTEVH